MYTQIQLIVNDDISVRHIALHDAEDIFNIINTQREYLGKWLPFVQFTKELKHSQGFIESVFASPEAYRELVFVVHYQDKLVGLIGFRDTDHGNNKTEIGYWLSEPMQKKGIMSQSVKRLVDYAFEELGMNRVQIKCAVGNVPSKNIPKRLGFVYEGIEREGELYADGSYMDIEVYSFLRKDWIKN